MARGHVALAMTTLVRIARKKALFLSEKMSGGHAALAMTVLGCLPLESNLPHPFADA